MRVLPVINVNTFHRQMLSLFQVVQSNDSQPILGRYNIQICRLDQVWVNDIIYLKTNEGD